jgi:CHAT domain-containing protein
MSKFLLSLFLVSLIVLCFSQELGNKQTTIELLTNYKAADKLYQQAEQIAEQSDYNESLVPQADAAYKKALAAFNLLLPSVTKSGYDSLTFFISLKQGLINHYFENLETAKQSYLSALAQQPKTNLKDSLFFQPTLFAASILYTQKKLDSAITLLDKAEKINQSYGNTLDETQRLYNLLGVIKYETGSYKQAISYFEKSLSLLSKTNTSQKSLRENYEINIASTFIKIDEYDTAKNIFLRLLKENVYNNEVYHKLGFIHLKESSFKEALGNFSKINYTNTSKTTDLYLNKAMAYSGLYQTDSATYYLNKAKTENIKWNGTRKNITNGLIYKYEADELAAKKKLNEAVNAYQQAIIQFDNNFNEIDATQNPNVFTGVYSYINLFNTLIAKAEVQRKMYDGKDYQPLKDAVNTYRSAYQLADYVEKTYTSDEARLFLGKIKHTAHIQPIDISLTLFRLTRKKEFLEQAYLFDQQNKATVLSLNVSEASLKKEAGTSSSLLQQEAGLKYSITRLSLKAATTTDSTEATKLTAQIRDESIALDKVREDLYTDPQWQSKRGISKIPTIKSLQKSLDHTTSLLSFHLAEKEVITFLISSDKFEYYKTTADELFYTDIETIKQSLHNIKAEQKYSGGSAALSLYAKLIKPLQKSLAQKNRLIIIPDDELNYLPFEALQDENRNYLVEQFSVQYQYSTALLGRQYNAPVNLSGTLAMAPFVSGGYNDTLTGTTYAALPSSANEVENLKGNILMGMEATKTNFLANANKYDILHLATHASANNEKPEYSFVTFYPTNNDYKLYATEINNLRLDSTSLVILSACETGTGQLVKGEGLLSLSRAFAYAGCPNIVTSLWKAEDQTTSFIITKLHAYLKKGFTKDKALQQAKIDLLKSSEISPRYKSPNYWAHFIFIGEYDAGTKSSNWWIIATCILTAGIIYILVQRKKAWR